MWSLFTQVYLKTSKYTIKIYILSLLLCSITKIVDCNSSTGNMEFGDYKLVRSSENSNSTSTIQIVTFQWEKVHIPYIITLWILVAALGKLGKLFNKIL